VWRALREKKYKKSVRVKGAPNSSQSSKLPAKGRQGDEDTAANGFTSRSSTDSSPRSATSFSALPSRLLLEEAKWELAGLHSFQLMSGDSGDNSSDANSVVGSEHSSVTAAGSLYGAQAYVRGTPLSARSPVDKFDMSPPTAHVSKHNPSSQTQRASRKRQLTDCAEGDQSPRTGSGSGDTPAQVSDNNLQTPVQRSS
jgi:hypothetical protein